MKAITDMESEDLATMTAKEFRARFSTGEGFSEGSTALRSQKPLYLAPNETVSEEVFKELGVMVDKLESDEQAAFYGIVGGVDLALSYITTIWQARQPKANEAAILTDINETALDYLQQRLDLFLRADSQDEYFAKLAEEMPEASKSLSLYFSRLDDTQKDNLWFSQPTGFQTLKSMVSQNRIKSFQSNYYGKGQLVFADLMSSLGQDAVVVYLSDIASVVTNKQRGKLDSVSRNSVVVGKAIEIDTPFMIIEANAVGKNYVSLAGTKAT